jgi:hypothetical protein
MEGAQEVTEGGRWHEGVRVAGTDVHLDTSWGAQVNGRRVT